MSKTSHTLLARLGAAVVALGLLVAGAAPAQAAVNYNDLPTIRTRYDAAGINWVNGLARYQTPAISIGQVGAGGLAYSRNYTEVTNSSIAVWSDLYTGKLYNDSASSGPYTVVLDGKIDIFQSAGSGTERESALFTGARLSWANSPNPPFEYITRDGDIVAFEMTTATEGRMKTITAANGAVTTLTYTDSGGLSRLQSVTNTFGYHLKFEYASNSTGSPAAWQTLVKVTAINGAVDYCAPTANDCAGLLTQAWPYLTFAESGSYGSTLTHTTTDILSRATVAVISNYRLASVTAPSGSTVTYTAPSTAGFVTTRQVSNGTDTSTYKFTAYSVSHPWLEMEVTDPMGGVQTSFFQNGTLLTLSDTNAIGATTEYSYGFGPLSQVDYPDGRSDRYFFDARYNVNETWRIPDDKSVPDTIKTYATYPASCTSSNYRMCNKPLTTTDARGAVTNYDYSTVHGGLEGVKLPAPTSGAVRPEERTTYSQHQAYIKNSLGAFVAAGPQIYLADRVSACVTSGPTTCSTLADEVRVDVTYGPTGAAANNLLPTTTTTGPGTGTGAATTTVTYDEFGNLLTTDGPLSGSADTTRYRYDAARRQVGVAGPAAYYPAWHHAVRTTYNVMDQPTLVEDGYVYTQSDAYWALFNTVTKASTSYDLLNRVEFKKALDLSGNPLSVTQYAYDANGQVQCVAVRMNPAVFGSLPASACTLGTQGSNGPDQITFASYNAAGQVEPVVAAYGTDLEHDLEASTYDAYGKVVARTDANGNLTSYEYDHHARLQKMFYPSKTLPLTPSTTDYEQYGYDANGNLTSLRLRDGTTVTNTYDALNRKLTGMQSSTYAYDNLSRLTSTTRSGQTVSYTYDAFSHVLTETQPQGTVTYQYDLAGRRTRMEWPDGEAVVYGWYGGPDLITIDIAGSYNFTLASYAYDPIGRVILTGRSNGDSTSFTYDDRSALNTLAMNLLGSSDDLTSSFSRDAATRIIGRSGTNSVYDWTPGSASPSTYTVNGLNQYTTAAGASPTYDARGNMTANGTKAYGYDIANHLTSLTVSGTPTASLAYDPVGRLWELAGASTTRFLYDGVDAIAEYDTSGNVLRRYVHGPGSDEPIVWFEGSGTYAPYSLHADERGSVIAVSQGSGAALTTMTYDAYGARTVSNPTYETRYGFTGQEWLKDIGLYYYKARMYSTELGRFMQTDPIGYGDGMNIYAYVRNDPVNGRDPSGMFKCSRYEEGGRVYVYYAETCGSGDVADVVVSAQSRCPDGYDRDDFGCWLAPSQGGGDDGAGGWGFATAVSDLVVKAMRYKRPDEPIFLTGLNCGIGGQVHRLAGDSIVLIGGGIAGIGATGVAVGTGLGVVGGATGNIPAAGAGVLLAGASAPVAVGGAAIQAAGAAESFIAGTSSRDLIKNSAGAIINATPLPSSVKTPLKLGVKFVARYAPDFRTCHVN